MDFTSSHPKEQSSAASLLSPTASVSTSILGVAESDNNTEQSCFPPPLVSSRPLSSLLTKPSHSFILPMPPTLSMFAIPHLPNSRSWRRKSVTNEAISQAETSSSIVISARPKSVPLCQHTCAHFRNMTSLCSASTSLQHFYEYKASQSQPDPALLPLPVKPTFHGTWLRTDGEKISAREKRSKLLGASDTGEIGEACSGCGDKLDICTERTIPALQNPPLDDRSFQSGQDIILFSVRNQKFRRTSRSSIFTNREGRDLISELPDDIQIPAWLPPLLVDGRMTIEEVPRWNRKMMISWRSWDGQAARLYHKEVVLPFWLWVERNFSMGGSGKNLNVFIERG